MSKLILKFGTRISSDFQSHEGRKSGVKFHRHLPNGEESAIKIATSNPDASLSIFFPALDYYEWSNNPKSDRDTILGENEIGFFDGNLMKYKENPELISEIGIAESGVLFGRLELENLTETESNCIIQGQIGDKEYIALCKKIANLIQSSIKSFLRIIQSYYGQYWIRIPEAWDSRRMSLSMYFKGPFKLFEWDLDGVKGNEFLPDEKVVKLPSLTGSFRSEISKEYITKSDWGDIEKISASNFPDSLFIDIFANTMRMLNLGYKKYAIIEFVSLLEISVDSYVKNKSSIFGEKARKDLQQFFTLSNNQKISIISVISDQFSTVEYQNILELVEIRNRLVHEGHVVILDNVEEKIKLSIKALSRLIYGREFKIPRMNSANVYMSDEEWDS
jgi:hypothetical protein